MRSLLNPARLARASAEHPWRTVGIWAGGLVASVVVIAALLAGALTTDQGFVSNPESERARTAIEDRQGTAERIVETVVIQPASEDAQAAVIAAVNPLDTVASAEPGASSPTTSLVQIVMAGDREQAGKDVEAVIEAAQTAAASAGATARFAGPASIDLDFQHIAEKDLQTGEAIGIPVALVILLIVFGALVSALLPLMLAGVAIVVSLALTALLGQVFELSFFVTNMITMMGLAVGVDYVLFIVSRYREERQRGLDKIAAIERAGSTASRAVLFSGVAVVVALLGLLIVPTTIFISLGAGAILVVLCAMAAALTLLPAVLALLGDRIDRGQVGRLLPSRFRRDDAGDGRGFWPRAVRTVMRRPVVWLVGTTALLAVAAVPYFSISTGAAGIETLPTAVESRQAFDVLADEFAVGGIAPARIAVADQAEADQITAAIAGDERFGTPVLTDGVLDVPINAPSTSDAAVGALRDLRSVASSPVGGETSMNADYFDIVDRYLPIVIGIVLALSFVVLLIAFRSLVVPVVAIAMNLLSVGAAYGMLVLVTQKGYGAGLLGFAEVPTIDAWIPLFLFSVLFGLSMDYHVFLLSRIRERYLATGDSTGAISFGITSSARLITGAALIMVAVFGGFAMGDLVMFQQMGFGLAVAILVDATLVRTILVPATMKLLGRWNWYLPRWLHRLPSVDVEGAGVEARA
jgi:putative drug exporter of the RND superfamily